VLRFLPKSFLHIFRPSRIRRLAELNGNQYLSSDSVRELQEAKFVKLIEHARSRVPYFRDILNDPEIRTLDDIASIPFLTKKIIQTNTDQLKAEGYHQGRFIPNTTGGSTGEKLGFFNDTEAHLAALIMRGNTWAGWKVGDKQALLWGAHGDISASKFSYRFMKRSLIHRNLMLSSYNMTDDDMFEYQRTINEYRPQLITGYSSALYLLAAFINKKGLRIHSPKGVICSAETLYDKQRQVIESAFGCRVFNRYGCREVGNIAQECEEHNGMHIYADHVIIEIVDESGRPCRPGETGEIVVTDLDNYVFPFIRYRIKDIGMMSARTCPCGRGLPMLEKVEGRVWDVIVGTDGRRVIGTLWLVEDIKGISQYQIIQPEHGRLTLRLVVTDEFCDASRSELIQHVKAKCGEDMTVVVDILEDIPLTESGKRRLVISSVSPFIE
jgi:phenylacetate-CoA ligase